MSTILLIEDDPMLTEMYQIIFEVNNFTVITANTGKAGLEKATLHLPDFILLDMMMGDMGGPEVLDKLKGVGETASIPVAIFSNLASQEKEVEALQKGAVAYLLKSDYEPKALAEKVRELLDSGHSQENQV